MKQVYSFILFMKSSEIIDIYFIFVVHNIHQNHMKTLLILFFSLFLLLSCRHTNPSQATDQDDMEEFVDTTPQATAIFWVDKIKNKRTK